jgi:hypothetical protein
MALSKKKQRHSKRITLSHRKRLPRKEGVGQQVVYGGEGESPIDIKTWRAVYFKVKKEHDHDTVQPVETHHIFEINFDVSGRFINTEEAANNPTSIDEIFRRFNIMEPTERYPNKLEEIYALLEGGMREAVTHTDAQIVTQTVPPMATVVPNTPGPTPGPGPGPTPGPGPGPTPGPGPGPTPDTSTPTTPAPDTSTPTTPAPDTSTPTTPAPTPAPTAHSIIPLAPLPRDGSI